MAKKTAEKDAVPFEGPAAEVVPEPHNESAPSAPEAKAVAVVASPTTALGAPRVKAQPRPEVVERVREAQESLESFNDIKPPLIRFKEGFSMSESTDEIESFEGVIIYTQESNVFYKDRFKPGVIRQPDCVSPDGRRPTSPNPVSPSCGDCPNNKFGSSKEGEGKACKNTRHVFVLVRNPETRELSVIPKLLRVPPTSLTLIKSYVMGLAADYGSYYAVATKFQVFKKSETQTHYNIKFSVAGRLTAEERADVAFIREGMMNWMRNGIVVMEAELLAEEGPSGPAAPAAAPVADESRF